MNEDVSPIEHGDFPLSCWFSGGGYYNHIDGDQKLTLDLMQKNLIFADET